MTQNYQAKKKANQRKKVRNCKVEKSHFIATKTECERKPQQKSIQTKSYTNKLQLISFLVYLLNFKLQNTKKNKHTRHLSQHKWRQKKKNVRTIWVISKSQGRKSCFTAIFWQNAMQTKANNDEHTSLSCVMDAITQCAVQNQTYTKQDLHRQIHLNTYTHTYMKQKLREKYREHS